jgi:flagellar hook-associated protein 2
MASITSAGLGSGLDIEGIITKLMQVEAQPLTALATKEASYQAKLSAFGSLKGALSSLQTAAQTLKNTSTFTGMTASSSDSTVFTATASSTATANTYDITVSKLAKAHSIRTNNLTDFATGATFEAGTLSIQIGSGTATNITLTAGKTLAEIATAINAASAGAAAMVINDGIYDRLVLTSSTTGATGGITFTATTTDDANATTRALTNLVGANLTTVQAAQNAELTVGGVAITRSSNTITDAITGVTLNLLKADVTTPPSAKLSVAKNTGTVTSAVAAFVKAYNDAVTGIKTMTAYDAANKRASVLTGDSTARSIQSQLSSLVSTSISGITGGISRLSDIGITVQKDGTLATDSSKLSAALADSTKDVKSLFTQTTTGNEGIAVRFNTILEGIVGSSGLITSRTDGITASIKDLGKRADALNLRLTSVEKRYRAQFTALDTLVASMNQTSTYLTQQLANLPGAASSE